MKRYICLLIILIAGLTSASAQDRKTWGEIGVSFDNQLLMTSSHLNLVHPTQYMPGIRVNLDVRLYEQWFGFYTLVGSFGSLKLKNDINHFGELNPEQNLIPINSSAVFSDESRPFSMNLGLGHRFFLKDWQLMPMLGLSMIELSQTSQSMLFKESGTSNLYNVIYRFEAEGKDGLDTLYGILLSVKSSKQISRRYWLNFGLNYTYSFTPVASTGEFRDYYDRRVLKQTYTSARLHTFSLSVGVGFR